MSPPPSWPAMVAAFGKIGLLSFGGPAAQMGLMHRVLVEERGWLDEERYLAGLSFCMLLPGPEAMQLATWTGWRLRGTAGGLLAGLLFVVPGALVVLALSAAYLRWGQLPTVEAAFVGVKAAALALVALALLRLGRKALATPAAKAIAVLAFAALFLLDLPFPLVVLAAALWGWWRASPAAAPPPPAPEARTVRTVAVWLAVWIGPLLAVAALGPPILGEVALFFSVLATVSFGGAYAVLAWMAQEAVEGRGWLDAGQMLDGLGLAETTPGPLILVTEFVGALAGHAAGGWALMPAAALVTLWATFAPCFLWVLAGAPHVERLGAMPRPAGALGAITAAVVGVIAALSLWFALHVLFATVEERWWGPARLWVPEPSTLQPLALGLLALALVALPRLGVAATLGLCAGLAAGLGALA